MMSYPGFSAIAELPLVTLPAAFEEADYVPPAPLPRGEQPKDVVILIEADIYA
jgi:hypothetical protein